MGAINSACEGCFGEKVTPANSHLNPKTIEEKRKSKSDPQEEISKSKGNLDTSRTQQTEGSARKQQPGSNNQVSKLKLSEENIPDKGKKMNIKDFDLIKVLGRGSFGKVYLVMKKSNKKYYALKTLKKEEILNRGHIDNALTEKNVLQNAKHPFVVRLRYSFQTDTTLYLVMDYCPGGELFMQLKKKGRFAEDTVRFYIAEVVLALQYLHEELNIIYRDLKPENILLEATGHIKITDFGLSKATKKSFSFCGTPEYLAPEILLGQGHDKAIDWWSLGCLTYEMLAGYPPFSSKNRTQLYQDILKTKPIMPAHFSEVSKDLLSKLLVRNPTKRLGHNHIDEIKKHEFFDSINWDELLNLKKDPPIVPTITRPDDVRNFDKLYLNEPVVETPTNNSKFLGDPNQFPSFTYVQKEIGNESYVDDTKFLMPK